ncbi:MAG: class I tRNA ligase family protein, partial [Chloroflexota bacterium]|nr:class I tRNA ligase family protein [Chloroflexota bacterium]
LEDRAPWTALKNDDLGFAHAGETLHTALQVISNLAILLTPILPFSSKQVWEMIGNSSDDSLTHWRPQAINEGTSLPTAKPIFAKLDLDSVEDIFVNGVA